MKFYTKWILLFLSFVSAFIILALNPQSFFYLSSYFFLYFIVPGYILTSFFNLQEKVPFIFRAGFFIPLSLVFYFPFIMYFSFIESFWHTLNTTVLAFYVLLFCFYLAIDKNQITYTKKEFQLKNLKKQKNYLFALMALILVVVICGTHFVDLYEDSHYHIFRISYYLKSNILSNAYHLSYPEPFTGPEQIIPNVMSADTLAWPTYDFGFYFITLANFCMASKTTVISFIYLFNKYLFVSAVLSIMFLGWTLFKNWRYQVYLFCTIIISFINLKNYYNTSRVGLPPYYFVDLFHPTNICTTLFLPLLLGVFLIVLKESKNKRNYILFLFLTIVGCTIHKILFIFLLSWIPLTGVIMYFSRKSKQDAQKITILFLMLLSVAISYIIYYINIKHIYSNSLLTTPSLTESRARDLISFHTRMDYFTKYASYLENTIYKTFYFPLSLIVVLAGLILYKRRALKTTTSIFLISSLGCFLVYMLPGMNYITVKFMRAFIQRMFSFLLVEIFVAAILFEIQKIRKIPQMIIIFSFFTLGLTIFTVTIDTFRKGNEKYLVSDERYSFSNYINKNLPDSTYYIADDATEFEILASTRLNSITFNPLQHAYIRAGVDEFGFQKRLHFFLYQHAEKDLFINEFKQKKISYIILGKKNYKEGFLETIDPKVYNENFMSLYDKDNNFKKEYEDSFHVIYKII